MSKKHLVVVESPAKAKTIEKYLGPDFRVLASYGHVRDLIPKEGAVDPEHGFAMRYQVVKSSERYVTAIQKAYSQADTLYLATDPDREGEAISWHLCELLHNGNGRDNKLVYRIAFHEITQRAVNEALAHPRSLSQDLVNAQQARRALDYLVGFNLSPLLWKKIKRGLSAGRVQSPALRLIVEREAEIEQFKRQEYWTIEANARKDDQEFTAKLSILEGAKLAQFDISNEAEARRIRQALLDVAHGRLKVSTVEKKERQRHPAAPFITSTLQQEAARKLGFSASRTMRVAQQLYEGVNLGAGSVGLITYMRTDSVNLAREALDEIRTLIVQRYGPAMLPPQARQFKTKAKNAQEAHEAIRPTSVLRIPDEVKGLLPLDQFRLYDLIWKRAVACQMISAILDTVAAELACGDQGIFRATGSSIREPGFMTVYLEGRDDTVESDERMLPEFVVGEWVSLVDILALQHFTEPPPRYTEASLIKTLEEYGIGRPSTYASILSTLEERNYVELDSRRFRPTDIGRVVNKFLTQHFAQYVDYDFTARLENELDDIARGEKDWIPVMHAFWEPFNRLVGEKTQSVSREEAVQARELGVDPKSGKPVTVRMGRYGPFVQIGTKDDPEKPRFAGLRPGQRMDEISLEEALALFVLPRNLGETPAGEPVQANIGRFGPYIKYGRQFASLKPEDDPYTITLARALERITEKQHAEANKIIHRFESSHIQVLNGRFGPYVTDGEKNAKIPKDQDPARLTEAQCKALLAEAPAKARKAPARRPSANRRQANG